jgi:hypothetical protein
MMENRIKRGTAQAGLSIPAKQTQGNRAAIALRIDIAEYDPSPRNNRISKGRVLKSILCIGGGQWNNVLVRGRA